MVQFDRMKEINIGIGELYIMEVNEETRKNQAVFAETARFRPSKSKFVWAGVFYIFALLPTLGLIVSLLDGSINKDDRAASIFGFVFCVILAVIGTLFIVSYFDIKKKMKIVLEKYGEENLRNSIRSELLWYYQYKIGNSRVYLTERFLIAPSEAVFRYEDICLVAKHVTKSNRGASLIQVVFYMNDGTSYFLCNGIKDSDIQRIFDICAQKNSEILLGYSKENQKLLEERVGVFKKPVMGMSIGASAMDPDEKQKKKKIACLFFGLLLLITPIIGFSGLFMSYSNDFKKEVNAVSESKRKKLEEDGYTEYKTAGTSLERISDGFDMKTGKIKPMIFVFELEDEDEYCLGISSKEKKFQQLSKFCSGFDIFCKEDERNKDREEEEDGTVMLEGDEYYYYAQVFSIDDCEVFGLAKENAKSDFYEKNRSNLVAVGIVCAIFLLTGIALLISGLKIKLEKANGQA